ncbi:MAG: response regulator [Thermoanaerobaculia bacterium]
MSDERLLLIVENNPLVAAAIEKAGERLQLRADFATDGWEAIEMLRNATYRAIVINTDLPRHSGYGVLSYLREENGNHLENVILTTSSDREVVRQRVTEPLQIIATTERVDDIADAMNTAFLIPEA